jgi:hypothetical protein
MTDMCPFCVDSEGFPVELVDGGCCPICGYNKYDDA